MQMSSSSTTLEPNSGLQRWKRRRSKENGDWKSGLWALFFLGPNLILFLVFMAYPVGYGLYISLYDYNVLTPKEWVGIGNYERFFRDPQTPDLIKRTIYYAVGASVPAVILPLIFAVLLTNAGPTKTLYRALFFLPIVTSPVAAAAVWKWLYAKDFGLINYGLRTVGGEPIEWLFNLRWAMPAVIIMTVWTLIPFNTILYTAGLQEVPRDLYDAASVDGASKIQQFRSITIPMITPTTFFVLLITMIGVLVGGFDIINVLTQGGPLRATDVLIYNIYVNAFERFRMGYASAEAYVLFAAVMVITLFNWTLQKRWVHYS